MITVGSPAFIRYIKEKEFAKVVLSGVVSRLPGGDLPGGGYDRNDGIMDDHFGLSGKLRVLDKLLQMYYTEGGKVLLFSHSTQSLGLIQNWLKSRGTYEYRRMDGSTPLSRRQQLTDEFNNDDYIFLFLLSIKATGLGLNLTSANRVIMCKWGSSITMHLSLLFHTHNFISFSFLFFQIQLMLVGIPAGKSKLKVCIRIL